MCILWREIAEITRDAEFKESEEHLIDNFDLKVCLIPLLQSGMALFDTHCKKTVLCLFALLCLSIVLLQSMCFQQCIIFSAKNGAFFSWRCLVQVLGLEIMGIWLLNMCQYCYGPIVHCTTYQIRDLRLRTNCRDSSMPEQHHMTLQETQHLVSLLGKNLFLSL